MRRGIHPVGRAAAALLCAAALVVGSAMAASKQATTNVILRSRASTSGTRLTTVKKGAIVEQIEALRNGWSKVRLSGGKTGYVMTRYLKTPTSNVAAAPSPTPAPAQATPVPTAAPVNATPDPVASMEAQALNAFAALNAERVRMGLPAVATDANLQAAATTRVVELTALYSHARPNGANYATAATGGSYATLYECIAAGPATGAAAMGEWFNASADRAALLNGSATRMGIAALQRNGVTYWVLLIDASSAAATATPTPTPAASNTSAVAARILELVNAERASAGLSKLTVGSMLQAGADVRAAELVTSFSHTRPDGSSCFTAVDSNAYMLLGENIAYGASGAEEVMNMWMNSTGHRENILKPEFAQIGIGVYASGGRLYFVQMFGTQR